MHFTNYLTCLLLNGQLIYCLNASKFKNKSDLIPWQWIKINLTLALAEAKNTPSLAL
jgi:hypothetical protein